MAAVRGILRWMMRWWEVRAAATAAVCTGNVYANLSPTGNPLANLTPDGNANANPTPTGEVLVDELS